MTIEVSLRKRKAKFHGEVGFYPDDPVAEDDCRALPLDTDAMHVISSPKNLALQRYLWALVTLVANNTEFFIDKDDAMEKLKLKARFAKLVQDPKTKKWELVPKSLKRLSNEQLQRLVNRILHIVISEIIPNMDEKALRKEIEEMVK